MLVCACVCVFASVICNWSAIAGVHKHQQQYRTTTNCVRGAPLIYVLVWHANKRAHTHTHANREITKHTLHARTPDSVHVDTKHTLANKLVRSLWLCFVVIFAHIRSCSRACCCQRMFVAGYIRADGPKRLAYKYIFI